LGLVLLLDPDVCINTTLANQQKHINSDKEARKHWECNLFVGGLECSLPTQHTFNVPLLHKAHVNARMACSASFSRGKTCAWRACSSACAQKQVRAGVKKKKEKKHTHTHTQKKYKERKKANETARETARERE
jgi:hypothetical protein